MDMASMSAAIQAGIESVAGTPPTPDGVAELKKLCDGIATGLVTYLPVGMLVDGIPGRVS